MEDAREEAKAEMGLDMAAEELFRPLTSLDAVEKRHFHHAVFQVTLPAGSNDGEEEDEEASGMVAMFLSLTGRLTKWLLKRLIDPRLNDDDD